MDFRNRFPSRLYRPAVEEEVDTELGFHLDMRIRELMERGMTEAQARRAALERFGDYARARRRCRAIGQQREQRMRVLQYLSELRQDVAFAFRQMLAAPAFSIVAVATLALGIGATTAIFSVVHAVVLRPLPVAGPERLVVVQSGWREMRHPLAPAHYLHLLQEQKVLQTIGAAQFSSFTLARVEGAERVIGARVTSGFFETFGVQAAAGRVFQEAESEPGRDQVVVLSQKLWKRQFGGDPAILGRDISLNQRPHKVIGIMPASFDFSADREELWVPLALTPDQKAVRSSHFLNVYARLAPNVSVRQAGEQLNALVKRRLEIWPDESAERTLHAIPLMRQFVGEYRDRLYLLLAAVTLVLLIACGNVSNLLLARGAARAAEIAVRSALGAGQGRLVRQLFTESMVLGVISAAGGVALAAWFTRLLITFSPPGVPRLEQARIDVMVLAFAVGIALVSSVVFGLLPAWRAAQTDVSSTLKEAGRSAGSRGPRDIVRSILIAAEVALALVLLVGAALLIRTAIEMQRIDPGFEPRGVFTARVQLPAGRYKDAASLLQVSRELEEAVRRIPGIRVSAITSSVPSISPFSNGLLPEGLALDLKNITQSDGVLVSPAYFDAMKLPIVEGRRFTDIDRTGSPLVVILNRTAAQRMWPGRSAIGKRLTSANPLGAATVVGIAEDVRIGGPSVPAPPTFYVPLAQLPADAWTLSLFVVVRTDTDPSGVAEAVRRAVAGVDSAIPVFGPRTMEERMAATVETARFNTLLLTILGAVGLLLSAVGIYGVIAYFASQRTSEIGIRLALGATRNDVVRMVVRQAAVPVLVGVVIGGGAAMVAARALASQLVNVETTDPTTFAGAAGLLISIAFFAALIPARRAAALDPTRALHAS